MSIARASCADTLIRAQVHVDLSCKPSWFATSVNPRGLVPCIHHQHRERIESSDLVKCVPCSSPPCDGRPSLRAIAGVHTPLDGTPVYIVLPMTVTVPQGLFKFCMILFEYLYLNCLDVPSLEALCVNTGG